MNDKFTIRDFFAYFLSGCAFFIALFFADFGRLSAFLYSQRENIKEYSTVIIFASLPMLYFAGQIIQSIDTILYGFGCIIWQSYKEKPTKLKKVVYYLFASHRISGNLNLQDISPSEFWKKCYELELVSKYGHSEYWHIMNDLFKGITLINLFFALFSFYYSHLLAGIIFTFLSLIFWYRARYYAVTFINAINGSRDALAYIKPENIK